MYNALLLAAFLLLALAVRGQTLGNPVVGYDEQFYLLVGDRMLHGAVPYVDIFDRKPIGLFLIYAGVRLLGGDGAIQYQLVAALAVAGTATLIAALVRATLRPAAGRTLAAAVAGALYILWLNFMECEGGQAPVFFNLPIAGAALLTLAALRHPARRFVLGSAAMALAGLAIQIKYTAAIEGGFFGLALVWATRGAGWRLLADALGWIAVALLPTALAAGWYWQHGALGAFVFANFRSIFGRLADPWTAQALGALLIAGILSPLAVLGWWGRGGAPRLHSPLVGRGAGRGGGDGRLSQSAI